MDLTLKPIAHIKNDFPTKFGIPRQSGLINGLKSKIVFTPEYRDANALRGIEGYSHLWLIWHFTDMKSEGFSPTVRPPRLGGNERVGVFATRSPNRPNPLGLSCVKLVEIQNDEKDGAVLIVEGADLMSGTPIFDIKPYLPISDLKSDATSGFAEHTSEYQLEVNLCDELASLLPTEKVKLLIEILKQDPRPAYHNDPERIYGFQFAGFEIKFKVKENILTVTDIAQN